jgi:hypothetical protein
VGCIELCSITRHRPVRPRASLCVPVRACGTGCRFTVVPLAVRPVVVFPLLVPLVALVARVVHWWCWWWFLLLVGNRIVDA